MTVEITLEAIRTSAVLAEVSLPNILRITYRAGLYYVGSESKGYQTVLELFENRDTLWPRGWNIPAGWEEIAESESGVGDYCCFPDGCGWTVGVVSHYEPLRGGGGERSVGSLDEATIVTLMVTPELTYRCLGSCMSYVKPKDSAHAEPLAAARTLILTRRVEKLLRAGVVVFKRKKDGFFAVVTRSKEDKRSMIKYPIKHFIDISDSDCNLVDTKLVDSIKHWLVENGFESPAISAAT